MAESTISEAIEGHPICKPKHGINSLDTKLKTILKILKHTEKVNNVHIYKVLYMNVLGIVPLQVQPIARLLEGDSVIIHKLIGPFL